jgi:hypothetical protein
MSFGMLMPGRNTQSNVQGGFSSGGTTTVNGNTYVSNLTITTRIGNTPNTYKAANSIEFIGEYVDNGNEEYEAFIVNQTNPDPNPTSGTVNSSNVDGYRYGFNGQMKSPELGSDNYTALYWEYRGATGSRWNLDPKGNASISPYATFNNNPIYYSDPLGDTTHYYSMKGQFLAGINNDGALNRVKVNDKMWNKVGGQLAQQMGIKTGFKNQEQRNDYVSALNSGLDNLEATGKYGDLISRETGNYQMDFSGSIIKTKYMIGSYNPKKQAEYGITGTMSLNSQFDNGSTLAVATYNFTSGPHGNGPTPNNNYVASVFIPIAAHPDDTGLFLAGLNYGWKLRLPDFNGRDGMLVHPDCNTIGTKGCIGIRENNATLIKLGNFLDTYINVQHRRMSVNFQIPNNPNYGNEGRVNTKLRQ